MADNISIPIYFDAVNHTTSMLKQVNKKIDQLTGKVSKVGRSWKNAFKSPVTLLSLDDAMDRLGQTFGSVTRMGSFYESQLAELSAITGITGQGLDALGAKARNSAKVFGGEAGKSIEVYKLLLSQLGPDLAKTPKVLSTMADNVSLLSKTMGGDTTAAVEVLTTAMNQYGVDVSNPIKAQKEMALMMNAMSAAAKEGSAELPAQKAAIQSVGGVAHSAGMQFNEMLSAIQALDKAGKKGSEGGIALRNALAVMSSGRFMEGTAKAALEAAGVDVAGLSDKTKSFTDRLRLLQPVVKDSALMSKLFGRENVLAGEALVRSIGTQEAMTKKISDTNTTQEQAAVVMDTYAEKMSRMKAWISDLGISFFNVSKDALPMLSMMGNSVSVFSSLGQVGSALSNVFGLQGLKMGGLGQKMMKLGKVFRLQSLWTGILTVKQWLMNIAMNANPIGLIVAAIAALIAIVTLIVVKYDEWGAAVSLLLGPFGMLINIIVMIKRNWAGIVAAFKDGGIVEGLKAIGKVMLDALLYPVQQLLELIAKITGLDIADTGAKKIAELRKGLEVQDTKVEHAVKNAGNSKQVTDNSTVNIHLNGGATQEDAQRVAESIGKAKDQGLRLAYSQ